MASIGIVSRRAEQKQAPVPIYIVWLLGDKLQIKLYLISWRICYTAAGMWGLLHASLIWRYLASEDIRSQVSCFHSTFQTDTLIASNARCECESSCAYSLSLCLLLRVWLSDRPGIWIFTTSKFPSSQRSAMRFLNGQPTLYRLCPWEKSPACVDSAESFCDWPRRAPGESWRITAKPQSDVIYYYLLLVHMCRFHRYP